jgi:low affinity Fe/Cu permease
MNEFFRRFAGRVSDAVGSSWAFIFAAGVVLAWAVSGPLFHFSDTWQLVINTGTTIITFLMVFLIQSTQNRDAKAIHLKLDELIRGERGARNKMIDLDKLSDKQLRDLESEYKRLIAGEGEEARAPEFARGDSAAAGGGRR